VTGKKDAHFWSASKFDLPKDNKDAFSDTINIRIVCSRIQGTDSQNTFIDTFLTRYSVSTTHYSI